MMRRATSYLLAVCASLLATAATATTWDEPWHEAVIAKAASFVKARVTANDPAKGITISVLTTIAGDAVPASLRIGSFGMLSLHSFSSVSDELRFDFRKNDTCYFFLMPADSGYAIATPTTGFAKVRDHEVYATYRHSYHQCLVNDTVYEASQRAMFLHAHGQPYDEAWVKQYITQQLSMMPGLPAGDNAQPDLFFSQHVALELIYHLQLSGYTDRVKIFLEAPFVHVQASAVRALGRDASAKLLLLDFLRSDRHADFAKVLAVQALRDLDARELAPQLKKFLKQASKEPVSFNGDIMDPRVATVFPASVHAAVQLLLDTWK